MKWQSCFICIMDTGLVVSQEENKHKFKALSPPTHFKKRAIISPPAVMRIVLVYFNGDMTLCWPAFDKPTRWNQSMKPSALSPPMNIREKMRCDSGSKQKSETLKEKKRRGETERERRRDKDRCWMKMEGQKEGRRDGDERGEKQ